MFNKQDIVILKGMFTDVKKEMRDELQSTVQASENRIISQITEFIDSRILPQISDLDRRVTKIEQHPKFA